MKELQEEIEKFLINEQERKGRSTITCWLDEKTAKIKNFGAITHAVGYIHSSCQCPSIYSFPKNTPDEDLKFIHSHQVKKLPIDFAGNAALMGIAKFLSLKAGGITLLDFIFNDDPSPLSIFAEKESQLKGWMDGLKKVIQARQPVLDAFNKQIYFPVKKNKYHVLIPLFPTSLYQVIHERIVATFGQKTDDNEETVEVKTSFWGLGSLKFGGSKPQNISYLNSIRTGKAYLLPSLPPQWKRIQQPPTREFEFLNRLSYLSNNILKHAIKYIKNNIHRDSNNEIRITINNYIEQILDVFIDLSFQIREFEPGWSQSSKISACEKRWLDPKNQESVDIECSSSNCAKSNTAEVDSESDWMRDLSNRLGLWLTAELSRDGPTLGDVYLKKFKKKFLNTIKEFD